MTFTFTAAVAWDPIGKQAVKNVSFQVYATTDTGYTTPLPITDPSNVAIPGNILNSGSQGVFPQFQQATNPAVVITDPAHTYVWTINCVPTDAAVANFISATGSATATQLNATYVPYPSLSPTGLYAARPAASTVKTGTYYHATDTQETYRAAGTAGANATTWDSVNGAGAELGYAERATAWDNTSATAGAWTDVPGLTITVTVGERPIVLDMTAYTLSDVVGDVNVSIFEGSTEIVRRLHHAASANDYSTSLAKRRLSPSQGAHTYKLSVYKNSGQVVTLVGGIAGPVATLQARNA